MNTPQGTPEEKKKALIDAFKSYDWIILHTDPINGKIYLHSTTVPSYIKKKVDEYKEEECTSYYIENRIKPPYILSSIYIDWLLMQLVQTGIPLYKVGNKEISCVADIKRLWDDAGLSNSTVLERKEYYRVMAYLEPQNLKIGKELTTELEPEKKGTPANTLQKVIPFPTPSGTQWREVKISFIDNENVCIKIKGKTTQINYTGMGFTGKKRGSPSKLWDFFKELANLNGSFVKWQNTEKVKIKELFSDLRKKLTDYFRIDGDPIPYKKTKDYRGYKTAFVIEDKSYAREYEASVRGHHMEYIPPKKTHHGYRDEIENDNEDNKNNLDD